MQRLGRRRRCVGVETPVGLRPRCERHGKYGWRSAPQLNFFEARCLRRKASAVCTSPQGCAVGCYPRNSADTVDRWRETPEIAVGWVSSLPQSSSCEFVLHKLNTGLEAREARDRRAGVPGKVLRCSNRAARATNQSRAKRRFGSAMAAAYPRHCCSPPPDGQGTEPPAFQDTFARSSRIEISVGTNSFCCGDGREIDTASYVQRPTLALQVLRVSR
ncbi:hypothetical protein VTG60DRAFT_4836 [Thermothelomyces hinnuleus]